jgi:hypothetical protein
MLIFLRVRLSKTPKHFKPFPNIRNTEARKSLQEHVRHRATVAGVRDSLENGGFSVMRVVERTGQMRLANGTALFNHHFIKLGFLDAWKKLVPGRETEAFLRLPRIRAPEDPEPTARKGSPLVLRAWLSTIPFCFRNRTGVPCFVPGD